MKATELRIGNWVTFSNMITSDRYYQITGRFFSGFNGPDNLDITPYYKPILLTDGWLVKFGFIKRDGNNICWDLGSFMIGWYGNKYATYIISLKQENNNLNFHSKIKYVHQLQNLYFALTGKELTIN